MVSTCWHLSCDLGCMSIGYSRIRSLFLSPRSDRGGYCKQRSIDTYDQSFGAAASALRDASFNVVSTSSKMAARSAWTADSASFALWFKAARRSSSSSSSHRNANGPIAML
jgi:hypothetical protein